MTTTVVPSIGQGAVFTQQGPGASPGYAAIDVRRSDSVGLQEGVYAASDFMAQQRVAGANMQVEIAMPVGGGAMVQGDSVNGQALYFVPVASGNYLETIATADATNPRIDQVILEIQDNIHDASGGNLARTRILTGTPTAGATLTNRTGAAALPGSALLLADVLVDAAVGSIVNAKIRDRRKWARGALSMVYIASSNYTTTAVTVAQVDVDATNLQPRIECSGVPVRVTFAGQCSHSVANTNIMLNCLMDNATPHDLEYIPCSVASGAHGFATNWQYLPAAGSHRFKPQYSGAAAGTTTLYSGATRPLVFTVEEIVRQNAPNNALTSG
jgi:hypothetical protein